MIKFLFLTSIFLFVSCSLSTPQNKWQYDSTAAYNAYKKDFLQDKVSLAKQDIKRSITNAKTGGDLTQLATIYLGQCALNKAVGVQDNCREYTDIASLIENKKLDAYYKFISLSYTKDDIALLSSEYQDFAGDVLKKDFHKASTDLLNIKNPVSQLVATSLIINNISNKTKYQVLDNISYYGYKKGILYLLHDISQNTLQKEKKQRIEKKILILQTR